MKISVVIPTYNSLDYLSHCLNSLFKFANIYEVIVIDDGSIDSTRDMIFDSFPQIFYKKVKNGGPARARNIGANIASGDIIFFIDADVEISLGRQVSILNCVQKKGLAICGGSILNKNNTRLSEIHHLIEFGDYTGSKTTEIKMMPSANIGMRKELFKKIGGFNEALLTGEDNDLCQRASRYGKILYSPNIKIIHDTQGGRKKLTSKQYKFGRHFIASRDENPHLKFQLPRSKLFIGVFYIPLVFANVLLLMRKPYFRQKRWRFLPAIPVLVVLRCYFWKGVFDSL